MSDKPLLKFAEESNRIERIYDIRKHLRHAAALERLIKEPQVTRDTLSTFVNSLEPNIHATRTQPVFIGGREAPKWDWVYMRLPNLLEEVYKNVITPMSAHKEYEYLHPFIDGNGRSGRALWLWQMVKFFDYDLRYGFLQMFYYQTLDEYSGGR